jgi:hypothetical protein
LCDGMPQHAHTAKDDPVESVRISRGLMEALRRIAKKEGRMIRWVLDTAIREWLKGQNHD